MKIDAFTCCSLLALTMFLAGRSTASQSTQSKASEAEEIEISNAPRSGQLPAVLVVDAGTLAAHYTSSADQISFVHGYVSGVMDSLKWADMVGPSYDQYSDACRTNLTSTSECGYVAGVDAVQRKKLPVTLIDFGYIKTSITARIQYDEQGEYLILRPKHRDPIYLAPSRIPANTFQSGMCYSLLGYLSLEGGYAPRGSGLLREFFPIEVVQKKRACGHQ